MSEDQLKVYHRQKFKEQLESDFTHSTQNDDISFKKTTETKRVCCCKKKVTRIVNDPRMDSEVSQPEGNEKMASVSSFEEIGMYDNGLSKKQVDSEDHTNSDVGVDVDEDLNSAKLDEL